jgi:perosamine synthetase
MLHVIGKGSHAEVVIGIVNTEPYENISIEEFMDKKFDFTPQDVFICGIGDNLKRKEVISRSSTFIKPTQWKNAIHVSAIIDKTVKLGVGNVVCAGAVIQTGSCIDSHCIINTNSSIDHHSRIDSFVHVAPNCAVCGTVTVGEGSFLGTSSSLMPKLVIAPWSFFRAGTVVKLSNGPIPMYKPYLKDTYSDEVKRVIDEGALTFATPHSSYVKKGEEFLSSLTKAKHVILMNNGTSATHCLYLALKFKYPTLKKIYVQNYVYVAVWNTALYEYEKTDLCVLPICPETLNIPQTKDFLNSLDQHSALVIVHNVGNIIDVPYIKSVRPDLILVEDNCEGMFGKYGDQFTGTASFCSAVSFFANKSITCGEGGAFMTNDTETYLHIRKLHNQGVTSERYIHDEIGYNYRITNIQAALLYPQLVDHASILAKKENLFKMYKTKLKIHPLINFVQKAPTTSDANWMFILHIKGSDYKTAHEFFEENLIEIRPLFYEIKRHKHLETIPHHTYNNNTQSPFNQQEYFMLPSYPTLDEIQVNYICEKVIAYANSIKNIL